MNLIPHVPEIHSFLLWPHALDQSDRIIGDLSRRFTILDVVQVEWSREHHSRNLARFYGVRLASRSQKEKHCGVGAFLVIVIRDDAPSYAERATLKGLRTVNTTTFDTRETYRAWTGGGHRVHATVSAREADRDLYLLLGRRPASYLESHREWRGSILRRAADLPGATGWRDAAGFFEAMEVTTDYTVLAGLGDMLAHDSGGGPELTLLVYDLWEALFVANGRAAGDDRTNPQLELMIDGRKVLVNLWEDAVGHLDPTWEKQLLRHPERHASGALVPSMPDRFYAILHATLARRSEPTAATRDELGSLSDAASLPRLGHANRATLERALEAFFASSGYARTSPQPLPIDTASDLVLPPLGPWSKLAALGRSWLPAARSMRRSSSRETP